MDCITSCVCGSQAHIASEQGPGKTHMLLVHLSENPKRNMPGGGGWGVAAAIEFNTHGIN